MSTIDITCPTCGKPFTPTTADIRRGAWRVCPSCRAGPSLSKTATDIRGGRRDDDDAGEAANERGGSGSHRPGVQARTGPNNDPKVSSRQE